MVNFSALPPAALVRALVALFLLALRLPAAGQAPAWQSARAVAVATAAANNNYSVVAATAIDAAGNVLMAGNFRNTVVLGGTVLNSLGGLDVFVAKYSPSTNQFIWAQRAGGTSDDRAYALVVSGTSVYIAGYFFSPVTSFGSASLTNSGDYDVFVAKLTDLGSASSFVWAQRAGGIRNDVAYALAVSGNRVYVAGYFESSIADFGLATLTNTNSATRSDIFVAKLTDAGSTSNFEWAQRAGGTGDDGATALAVSGNSVYVVGSFGSSTAGFGTTTLTNVSTNGSFDAFVAKLTDAGATSSFAWVQRAGGTGYDQATALAVSGTSVYVTGLFAGLAASFGTNILNSAGSSDLFVAKLTDVGSMSSFMWAQRAGGADDDRPTAMAVSNSSVFVTGYLISRTADFGSTILTSTGTYDLFVGKLTDAGSTGSFAWAQRAGGMGGTGTVYANTLSVNGTSVHVSGSFSSPTASFGPTTINNPDPNAPLGFLASLTDPTLMATTAAIPRTPASLFPNPARHAATLRLPAGMAPAPLTLTDALGRPVRRYPAPAGPETALDLRGLPAGLYLLRGAGPAQRLAVE